jgi:hypothetical protein
MRENGRGFITDFAASLLSSWTPTQSHDSGNHISGYDHLKTADVRSSPGCRKTASSTVSNLVKIMIFKIAVLFIGLGSLMT